MSRKVVAKSRGTSSNKATVTDDNNDDGGNKDVRSAIRCSPQEDDHSDTIKGAAASRDKHAEEDENENYLDLPPFPSYWRTFIICAVIPLLLLILPGLLEEIIRAEYAQMGNFLFSGFGFVPSPDSRYTPTGSSGIGSEDEWTTKTPSSTPKTIITPADNKINIIESSKSASKGPTKKPSTKRSQQTNNDQRDQFDDAIRKLRLKVKVSLYLSET
jgi:hypothetical protein